MLETVLQATCSRTALILVHGEQHFERLGNISVKCTKSLFAHLLVVELLHWSRDGQACFCSLKMYMYIYGYIWINNQPYCMCMLEDK